MTFPDKKYDHIGDLAADYFGCARTAQASVDLAKLAAAAELLEAAYERGAYVFVCGNGGSASISNHLSCDHLKGAQTDTGLLPRVVSLAATMETVTAIANDFSFDDIFVYQLRTLASEGDILISISSSGDSENVVRACEWARDNGVSVISMTGFSCGRSAKLAHVNLHVDGDNYGVLEDTHQGLMHILAQFIRHKRMDADLIAERKF